MGAVLGVPVAVLAFVVYMAIRNGYKAQEAERKLRERR
jgi:hypothetical protein